MKNKEKIKELKSQVQDLKFRNVMLEEDNAELVQQLERSACPSPEPYFPKITKHEAYHLALEFYKNQSDRNLTLNSFLSVVDEIFEWYNKQEDNPQSENSIATWTELVTRLSFKFETRPEGGFQFDPVQIFNEFKDEFLITQK